VQRELGITTVLVTHDQEEAFALADTIGVMNHGRLLEVGHPHDPVRTAATRFVATFLGAANLLLARQSADGIRFGATPVTAEASSPCTPDASTKWSRCCGPRKSKWPTRETAVLELHRARRRRGDRLHRRARTPARAPAG
jgi:ABC-type Fe3+/spermidine/putrescine transport system ATPase subunit